MGGCSGISPTRGCYLRPTADLPNHTLALAEVSQLLARPSPPYLDEKRSDSIALMCPSHGLRACGGRGGRGEMRERGDPISLGILGTHHEVSRVPAADVKEQW